MVTVKPRTRAGSWAVFDRRYKPVTDADDAILRLWNDPQIKTADPSLVWTVVDCDGRLYVVPGIATVNYFARILCSVPWNDSEVNNTGYIY